MDVRKCALTPKPPAQKRIAVPTLTKTQQRPLRRAGDLVSVPA